MTKVEPQSIIRRNLARRSVLFAALDEECEAVFEQLGDDDDYCDDVREAPLCRLPARREHDQGRSGGTAPTSVAKGRPHCGECPIAFLIA
ncbi:MAG: hypothetical protein GEU95_20510 [Rhizobiales bacterium]|nr:hypothetical protein [Hyphomicrobiales bacterium]